MLALVIFGILIAYLAIAVFFVRATLRSAREAGLATKQRWVRGGLVALVFYLIPFWDWIPTVVAHQYYCATEAKFEVYKTIEQWKAENAEVVQELRFDPRAKSFQIGGYERSSLNQRLASDRLYKEPIFLTVARRVGRIVDVKDGRVLAEWVDFRRGDPPFSVGGTGAWKFWLLANTCNGDSNGYWGRFTQFEQQAQKLAFGTK